MYYIPVRGHSFLSDDRDFVEIEKLKRNTEYVPNPLFWKELIRNIYSVVDGHGFMIKDFTGTFNKIKKKYYQKKTNF